LFSIHVLRTFGRAYMATYMDTQCTTSLLICIGDGMEM
jgi:hypothetical protein